MMSPETAELIRPDPEPEIPAPDYCVRLAPINQEGLMIGFALKLQKDVSERTRKVVDSVIGQRVTAGLKGDDFYVHFWRFVYPRARHDARWREFQAIMSEVAERSQTDLEFVDWRDPNSEVAKLLEREGPEFDLDKRVRALVDVLDSTPETVEIETPPPTERTCEAASENKSEGYTRIPNEVLDDATLSVGARFTYGLLLRHAYGKDYCFPSQKRLAALMGISDKWLRTHLRELETAGLVKTERKDRTRHNRYRLQRLVAREGNHASHQADDRK
jgi:hypothetical protein